MKRKIVGCTAIIFIMISSLLFGAGRITSAQNEPYKIVVVLSVTGGGSFLGDPEKKTVEMIAEEVNKNGGIDGHPLELIIVDDESDPTKCNLAVKKLIKTDKAPLILGPSVSGNSLAVAGVAEEAQIPLISFAASNKIVTPVENHKFIFKVAPSDSLVVEKMFNYMKSKGISKIAILTVSDGFGASGREELVKLAPANGIEIIADERYGPQDADLTAQMTKIRSTRPQAIVNWSTGPTQILVVKTWRDLAMDSIPLYQSHGFGSLKNVEMLGKAAEGVLLPLSRVNVGDLLPEGQPQKKKILEYKSAYEARYKEPISAFGGHAWDGMELAVSALKAVGPDPAKIRDSIENTEGFIGMHGIFNMSERDHNGLSKEDLVMIEVMDSRWALAK